MCPCALGSSGSSDINFHPYQDAAADLYADASLHADANGYIYTGAYRYPAADGHSNAGTADEYAYPGSAYQYAKACPAHRYPYSAATPADGASTVSL